LDLASHARHLPLRLVLDLLEARRHAHRQQLDPLPERLLQLQLRRRAVDCWCGRVRPVQPRRHLPCVSGELVCA
tara:strand:- start:270 stop:491 length:222 start_codon:yes stop_codon:yes gene_type:complete